MHLQWFDRMWSILGCHLWSPTRLGGVCLSADLARIVCRWAHIMWKKICFLIRGGGIWLREACQTSLHTVGTSPHPQWCLDADLQSTYEYLPFFHGESLPWHVHAWLQALLRSWKDQGSRHLLVSCAPIHYLYRTDMMSYPTQSIIESIRDASTSGGIQHKWNWCPKLFHLQCSLDIVAVQQTSSTKRSAWSCVSLKFQTRQYHQMRYHRYIRFAIWNTPSRHLPRVTPFQYVLSLMDSWSLCLFFMMTSRLGSGVAG